MAFLPWAINSAASPATPVPQSKIRRSPLAVVSSTQEVLPPKWFVPGPGVAIDPLVPQKRTLMGLRLPACGIDRQEIRFHCSRVSRQLRRLRVDSGPAGFARWAILLSSRSIRNAHGKMATLPLDPT
jgi:hypothetical protein